MTDNEYELEAILDRYFAGELDGSAREKLERDWPEKIAEERVLRDRMGAIFVAPPIGEVAGWQAGFREQRRLGWAKWGIGIVCLLAVVGGAIGIFWSDSSSAKSDASSAERIYLLAEETGFVPKYPERSASELAVKITSKLGRSVRIAETNSGVEWLGFSPIPGGTPLRVMLFARVDGANVAAILDVVRSKTESPAPDRKGPRTFSEFRKGLDIVEITPLDKPRLIPFITGVAEK